MISIAPNSWPEFQGLFHQNGEFIYRINYRIYNAYTLDLIQGHLEGRWEKLLPFDIDSQGSQVLVIIGGGRYKLFQQSSNGDFIGLSPQRCIIFPEIRIRTLKIPQPNGRDNQELPLIPVSDSMLTVIENLRRPISDQGIINTLNQEIARRPLISSTETNQKFLLSYETLLKRLYNLPGYDALPEFLNIPSQNESTTKVNFIPFSQVSSIQIERYIIDPLLQPWADNPSINKILTIFDKNGMTYLVHAQYDQNTNQIFPPI